MTPDDPKPGELCKPCREARAVEHYHNIKAVYCQRCKSLQERALLAERSGHSRLMGYTASGQEVHGLGVRQEPGPIHLALGEARAFLSLVQLAAAKLQRIHDLASDSQRVATPLDVAADSVRQAEDWGTDLVNQLEELASTKINS